MQSLVLGHIWGGGREWTYGAWPQAWVDRGITEDITVLELFPLLVSLHIWRNDLRNKKILFRVDNLAVLHIVNSMTSKSDHGFYIEMLSVEHCCKDTASEWLL